MIPQEKSSLWAYLNYILVLPLTAIALTVYAQQETLPVSKAEITDSTETRITGTESTLIIKRKTDGNGIKVYRNGSPADSVIIISYDATSVKVSKNEAVPDSLGFQIFSVGNKKLNVSSSGNFNMDDVKVVLIDGELKPVDDFYKINPKDIKSIGLSIGDYSALYGKDAKKGILSITTK